MYVGRCRKNSEDIANYMSELQMECRSICPKTCQNISQIRPENIAYFQNVSRCARMHCKQFARTYARCLVTICISNDYMSYTLSEHIVNMLNISVQMQARQNDRMYRNLWPSTWQINAKQQDNILQMKCQNNAGEHVSSR